MSEEKQEGTIFHFTRIKTGADVEFYDIQADIRCILPAAARQVCDDLLFAHKNDPEWRYQMSFLSNCIKVFTIRVSEDRTPLVQQMDAFIEAISTLPRPVFAQFASGLFIVLMSTYAAFQRRDVKFDAKSERTALTTASFCDVIRLLPQELKNAVEKALENTEALREPCVSVSDLSIAEIVDDNGKKLGELDHLKERANMFINVEGDISWEGLAKACDRMFCSVPDDTPLQDKVSLALAYPVYTLPTECEIPNNDAEGKD